MWKYGALLICLSGYCLAGPVGVTKRNIAIGQQKANDDAASSLEPSSDEMMIMSSLSLPSNATSIRADITDNFSCENKPYGYYADVDNDCQIFHVCLPVTYADGKENTFRWSFICPEETVFSQESFTCMRPDDMPNSCEESFKYYELNGNFGNVEQESEKETNEMSASEAMKPVMEAEPAPVEPEVEKQVKIQKPNRRKPGVSYASQKKPANSFPLRKIPQVQYPFHPNAEEQTPMNEETIMPLEEVNNEAEEEEVQAPVTHKFSRRPIIPMSNSLKDKMQTVKPETVNAIRSDLYNQKRKRPIMFNKKPIEEEVDNAAEETLQEELPAPVPLVPMQETETVADISNNNLEVKVEAQPAKDETPVPEPNFSHVEPELSNANTETEMADAESQASANNEVVVKSEVPAEEEQALEEQLMEAEATDNQSAEAQPEAAQPLAEEPVQAVVPEVLEAFEEIPAVVAESEEPAADPITNLDHPKENEVSQEETQSAEEEPKPAENMQELEENLLPQESAQETEMSQESEGAEENFPAAEEPQAVEVVEAADEPQAVEESQVPEKSAEDSQVSEETIPADETEAVAETEVAKDEVQAVEETLNVAEEPTMSQEAEASDENQSVEEQQMNVEEAKPDVESEADPESENNSQELLMAQANESLSAADEPLENEMTPAVEPVQSVVEHAAAAPEQPIVVEDAPEVPMAVDPQTLNTELAGEPQQDSSPFAEPTIFEENSEEAAAVVPAQTVEEMEEEKPVEAPESMSATEEMTQQNPAVQQMFEETLDDDKKQTLGGFKPVDPAMAAEAEQLIADFINTLRKNEFVNEQPGMPVQVPVQVPVSEVDVPDVAEHESSAVEDVSEVEEESNDKQDAADEVKEQQSEEDLPQPQIVEEQVSSEESKVEEMGSPKGSEEEVKSEEASMSEETNNLEDKPEEESPKEEQQPSEESTMILPSMPQESYQIPVQVITAPMAPMPLQEASNEQENAAVEPEPMELSSNSQEKSDSEVKQPAVVLEGNKPLSIDDIVELVKERLDQMPKDKMETPMQLEQVLGEAQPNEDQVVPEASQAENEPSEEVQQSEEEIIMPIYHRAAEADAPAVQETVSASVETAADNSGDASAGDAVETQEKSARFFRSRGLHGGKADPRKRRFLFRSDAS